MLIDSIKFKGHRCFKNDWAGFETIKPINVIIGRNNTGKSHLLDLVEALCSQEIQSIGKEKRWKFQCTGKLMEVDLAIEFDKTTRFYTNGLQYNQWNSQGRYLVGNKIKWETNLDGEVHETPSAEATQHIGNEPFRGLDEGAYKSLRRIVQKGYHMLHKRGYRRLSAERDIRPEQASNALALSPDGTGATNIIRRYIHSSSSKLSRDLIQKDLLAALNEIFGQDGKFTEIESQHHDEGESGHPVNTWEIFLAEEKKGLVALSRSGSGLKTIILVLLNLLIVPQITNTEKKKCVFAFEELENNLHPALLRRLLKYIERYALRENALIFLTTHSSGTLDLFGTSKDAQILHVSHNGESASTTTVSAHFDRAGVISELGAKPSDLLQANGIIWVEGPSDRIYINRWIELFSDGKWKEGRDYQCAFYGGSLLARVEFQPSDETNKELANLLQVNPNVVVVCDSDRKSAEDGLKGRVQRICEEIQKVPRSYTWVTEAKEIENYLPGSVLTRVFASDSLPDPKQYEVVLPRSSDSETKSYLEKHLKRKTYEKMELAIQTTPLMTKELMAARFDLEKEVNAIIDKIAAWNS
ncbi:MAG: AAA family ATPase [Verrucomicrobiota bacterium]